MQIALTLISIYGYQFDYNTDECLLLYVEIRCSYRTKLQLRVHIGLYTCRLLSEIVRMEKVMSHINVILYEIYDIRSQVSSYRNLFKQPHTIHLSRLITRESEIHIRHNSLLISRNSIVGLDQQTFLRVSFPFRHLADVGRYKQPILGGPKEPCISKNY